MRNPDPADIFILQTNTSNIGVGAVLSQGAEEWPVAYFSKKLLDREKNYSVVKKECLAVVLGIKTFEIYLLGKPFILQTDHKALKWLQEFKEKNTCLTRWSLALQPYNFTIQHRKGTENANADVLSRLPTQSDEMDMTRTACYWRREKCDRRVTVQLYSCVCVLLLLLLLSL